jgi:hypothetical protein
MLKNMLCPLKFGEKKKNIVYCMLIQRDSRCSVPKLINEKVSVPKEVDGGHLITASENVSRLSHVGEEKGGNTVPRFFSAKIWTLNHPCRETHETILNPLSYLVICTGTVIRINHKWCRKVGMVSYRLY